jgi:DDE family transposase
VETTGSVSAIAAKKKGSLTCGSTTIYGEGHSRPTQPGIIADQTIALDGFATRKDYPVHLRRVRFKDPESEKTLVFLTNQFALPAASICALYKSRWQVELFFKWIKQHLRIKQFYGTSDNAVKTQIWIAVSVYVLVAIVKKRLALEASLYTLLQIFSVTLFEKMPMPQALSETGTHIRGKRNRQAIEFVRLLTGQQ